MGRISSNRSAGRCKARNDSFAPLRDTRSMFTSARYGLLNVWPWPPAAKQPSGNVAFVPIPKRKPGNTNIDKPSTGFSLRSHESQNIGKPPADVSASFIPFGWGSVTLLLEPPGGNSTVYKKQLHICAGFVDYPKAMDVKRTS